MWPTVILLVLVPAFALFGYSGYQNLSKYEDGVAGFNIFNKATPSPSLEPTPEPTPYDYAWDDPTPVPTYQPQAPNIKNVFECVGPDGKKFKTTQEECTKFNAAWGNKQNTSKTSTQKSNTSTGTVSVPCTTVNGLSFGYGNTIEEANKSCADLQAYANKLKANGQALIDDFNAKLDTINNTSTTYTQTVDSTAYNNCRSSADSNYENGIQNASAYSGSARQAMIEITTNTHNSALSACESIPH